MDTCAPKRSRSAPSPDDTFGRSLMPSRTLGHLVNSTDDHVANHPLGSFGLEPRLQRGDTFGRPSSTTQTLAHLANFGDNFPNSLERLPPLTLAGTFGRSSTTFRTLGHLPSPADDHVDEQLTRDWKIPDASDKLLATSRTLEHLQSRENIDDRGDDNLPRSFDLVLDGALLRKASYGTRNDLLPNSWLDAEFRRDQQMILDAMGTNRRSCSSTMFGRTSTDVHIPGEVTSASFFATFRHRRRPASDVHDQHTRPKTASYLSRNVRVNGSAMLMAPRPIPVNRKITNDKGFWNPTSLEPRRRTHTAPAVITRNVESRERPRHQTVPPLSISCSPKGKLSITVNMDHLISASIDKTEQASTQESKVINEDEDSISLNGNVGSTESLPNVVNKLPVLKQSSFSSRRKQNCVYVTQSSPADDADIDSSDYNQDRERDFVEKSESKAVDPFERLLKGLREPRFRRLVDRDDDGAEDVEQAGDVDGDMDDMNGFRKDLDLAIGKLEQLRSNFVQAAGMEF